MARFRGERGIITARRILSIDTNITSLTRVVNYMMYRGDILVEGYNDDFGRVSMKRNKLETILFLFLYGTKRKSMDEVCIHYLKAKCEMNLREVHDVNHLDKIYIGEHSLSVFFKK